MYFPTGMEKERWWLALLKATERVGEGDRGVASCLEHERYLLEAILASWKESGGSGTGVGRGNGSASKVASTEKAPVPPSKGGFFWRSNVTPKKQQQQRKQELAAASTATIPDSFDTLVDGAVMDTRWLNLLIGRMWYVWCMTLNGRMLMPKCTHFCLTRYQAQLV